MRRSRKAPKRPPFTSSEKSQDRRGGPAEIHDKTAQASRQGAVSQPRERWWLLLLALATLGAFAPALGGDFLWDDAIIFMIADKSPASFWFSVHQPDYWPVTYTVLWTLWRVFHNATWGYHLTNTAIHVANVMLWWRVLGRLGMSRGRLLAVAIFALHPLQVESVAYIFQLKTTLALAFFLLAFDRYLMAIDQAHRARFDYALSLAFFALACLTKTSAAMLPFALLVAHQLLASSWRVALARVLPFFAMGAASAGMTVWMAGKNATSAIIWNAPFSTRVTTAAYNAWFYVGKFLLPVGLTVAYPKVVLAAGQVASWLPLVAWLATLAALWGLRRRPVAAAGLAGALFFLSQMAPVLGLSNIFFMKWSLVADHWSYLALMGLIAPLSLGLTKALARLGSFASVPLCGLALGLLALSLHGSVAFRSPTELWKDTLRKNPAADIALTSLGHEAYSKADYRGALDFYQQAVRVQPDNDEAHFGVASSLSGLGQGATARPEVERTLALNPRHAKAHNQIGVFELDAHHYDKARVAFETAVALDTSFAEAYGNLSLVYRELGQLERALTYQRTASELAPRDDRVLVNLGGLLVDLGRFAEAEVALNKVIDLNPAQAMAYFNLARVYKRAPSTYERAIRALEDGLKYSPQNSRAKDELAALLAGHPLP